MGSRYAEIAFTDAVKRVQEAEGTRDSYARREGGETTNDRMGPREAGFISQRASFYMATVSETGWPYIQHRGGPPGFVRVLDESTLGFADFRGNRQYVSVGNLAGDGRVSLFFMDYMNSARLKLFGRARITEDGGILSRLTVPDYSARVERGILIDVAAFDWNCPQHIPQMLTRDEVEDVVAPMRAHIARLEALLGETRPTPDSES